MRPVSDVAVIACGGGACTILRECPLDDVPVSFVNPRETAISDEVPENAPLASGNHDSIKEVLEGKRVVILFSTLGGFSGTGMQTEIASLAKGMGVKVISVLQLPMKLEKERRQRAIETVNAIQFSVDRIIIMDMDTSVSNRQDSQAKFRAFFRSNGHRISSAIEAVISMLEGPFFSTFPEKAYTYSYVTEDDPRVAVDVALRSSEFPTNPALGKIIVTVSSTFESALFDGIEDDVVSRTGIMPELINRDDSDDTKILVFLPVRIR